MPDMEPSKPSMLTLIADGISEGLHPDERTAFLDALPSDDPPVEFRFLAEAMQASNPGPPTSQSLLKSTLDLLGLPESKNLRRDDPGILLCALALRLAEADQNPRNFLYAVYLFNPEGRFVPLRKVPYVFDTAEQVRSRSGGISLGAYWKACRKQRDILLRLVSDV